MTVAFREPADPVDLNEPDIIVTFEASRGSFTIPADIIALADLGDDYELRRFIARHLPDRTPGDVLQTTRRAQRDGSAHITWRLIRIHRRRA